MAHLPEDKFPGVFDVGIDGIGLIQSLLAASLARVGKSILHLDKNPYYGDTWANIMYRDLEQWVKGEVEEVTVVDVSTSGGWGPSVFLNSLQCIQAVCCRMHARPFGKYALQEHA